MNTSTIRRIFATLVVLTAAIHTALAVRLSGRVVDKADGEPLAFASIEVNPGKHVMATDADGRWNMDIPGGKYTVTASYVGYATKSRVVTLTDAIALDIRLETSATVLGQVTVTARENRGITTSSRIDRSAMEHLQPTSFTDILELLPGGISKNPDMGSVNTITLRETGAVSATGERSSLSSQYATTSMGTAFVVDGAPINTDANIQGIPASTTSDPESRRDMTNRGVDMRTISTDNIESVEIVRGIPSAEYGNLTSGVVNIKRIARATPFTARLKVDEYSKLFSFGKGLALGKHVLNIDAGWLDSKTDPRDNLENYKRANASLRSRLHWDAPSVTTLWNIGADYTGSFDNAKVDPDINYNRVDEYRTRYNRIALTSNLNFNFKKTLWLSAVHISTAFSYQHDRLERTLLVSPRRAAVAPTSYDSGVHDGKLLLGEYIADYTNDGQPLSLYLKARAGGALGSDAARHAWKFGVEYTLSKNIGDGQVYDLERPLSASWQTRPRAFKDIPALHVVSMFLEDNFTAIIGRNTLELQGGVRTIQLAGLPGERYLSGRIYLDPRVNAVWRFAATADGFKPWIAGGWGLTTRMPTADQLYPQNVYLDFMQLNYYSPSDPSRLSRINLRTYIESPVNNDLRAARNRKWEVRAGFNWRGNEFSVTYFDEHMSSGFRYSPRYSAYAYRQYDATAIDPSTLTAPPALEDLPYTDTSILGGYSRVTNGSRIDKRGIEFQLNTVRWKALETSLIITGAWFRTRYSNSQDMMTPVSATIGNTAVSDKFIGVYPTDDGRINEQFSTNFMFDTQIRRWGLIFTTTVQCQWWLKTRRLRQNGVPSQYLSAYDGLYHTYTKADAQDPVLRTLIISYNDESFRTQTVAPAIYVNLKATKKIGNWMKISAFVNRIIDYLPSYHSNGILLRRYSSAYFGMEANLTF